VRQIEMISITAEGRSGHMECLARARSCLYRSDHQEGSRQSRGVAAVPAISASLQQAHTGSCHSGSCICTMKVLPLCSTTGHAVPDAVTGWAPLGPSVSTAAKRWAKKRSESAGRDEQEPMVNQVKTSLKHKMKALERQIRRSRHLNWQA
jgi:hypothetical protein